MVPTSRFDRPDVRTARLIDVALQVQRVAGTRAAAVLLAGSGVGLRLVVRVLAEPSQRRGGRPGFALVRPGG